MVQYITNGIKVSVETFYQKDYSNPLQDEFMFAYRITIDNIGNYPIRVLGRHWHIFDSNGTYREVEGEGIVGMQPVIRCGESYEYVSGCNLHTEMGTMYGQYEVENLSTKQKEFVSIPLFELIYPPKLN